MGPGNNVLDGGLYIPMGRGNFEGKWASHIKYRNTAVIYAKTAQRTDRHAVWVVGTDRPMESCVRWGSRSPMGRDNFGGRSPIVKYRDFLP